MRIKLLPWLTTYILITACGQSGSQKTEAISLRLSVNKGQTFSYTISSTQEMEQDTRGAKSHITNNLGFTYDFEVTTETDSAINTTARISRIKIKTAENEEGGVEYDSDVQQPDAINQQLHTIFSNLRDKPFETIFSRGGNVQQVKGLSELIKNVQANTPGANPMQGDEQTQQNLTQALNLYPAQPVKTGDSWTDKDTLQSQGVSMLADKKFRITRIEDGTVFIKVNTSYSDSHLPAQDPRLKIETDGSQEGTVEIDIKTGIIKKANLKSEIYIVISGLGQSHPVKLREKTIIEGKLGKR